MNAAATTSSVPTCATEPTRCEDAAELARCGNATSLAAGLEHTRERTLAMVTAWRAQLGDELRIDYDETLNPLRWELGHIGWFEEWWLTRQAQRGAGWRADPHAARLPSIQPRADGWYDSSLVEHRARWTLDLPDIDRIFDDVAAQRDATMALLRHLSPDERDADALYFFRLALMHEDMHAEAWLMMAQQLGLAPGDPLIAAGTRTNAGQSRHARGEARVEGCVIDTGTASQDGFNFDNECGRRLETLEPFAIDTAAVTWRRFLPFVEGGGYVDARWWSADGWTWREARQARHPRFLRRSRDGRWEQQQFDRWCDVDASHAASHLTFHESQAWCRWAGRALPTEAQWRAAQQTLGATFRWGEVWEWTASPFEPFEGFTPHPYRDYSQPWFDGRPVLKGASTWTHPHMRHPAYRNYFLPHRHDVPAGFRSVERAARRV